MNISSDLISIVYKYSNYGVLSGSQIVVGRDLWTSLHCTASSLSYLHGDSLSSDLPFHYPSGFSSLTLPALHCTVLYTVPTACSISHCIVSISLLWVWGSSAPQLTRLEGSVWHLICSMKHVRAFHSLSHSPVGCTDIITRVVRLTW